MSEAREKKSVKSKIIEPHVEDCYAVQNTEKGIWSTPWAIFKGVVNYGTNHSPFDKRGDSVRWILAVCNNTQCSAKVAVVEKDLLNKLVVK